MSKAETGLATGPANVPQRPLSKSNIEKGTTVSKTPREIGNTNDVCRTMKCGRTKVWRLEREDPDFPPARDIAGTKKWFMDEIAAYMESRPRRQYAPLKIKSVVG